MSIKQSIIHKGYPKNSIIFGHDNVDSILHKMIKTSSLHGSLVFSGNDGIGKASYAISFIKNLLSHRVNQVNTGDIDFTYINDAMCALIDAGTHPNFYCLTPKYDEKKKNFKNIITVDDIREVNSFIHMTSSNDRYKLILIDAIDNMNINACNALLKTLEEQTKNTIFILICHNYDTVLPTVKSRCLNINFDNLTNTNMINTLNMIDIEVNKELFSLCNGSISQYLWYMNDNNKKIEHKISSIIKNGTFDDVFSLVLLLKTVDSTGFDNIFNIIINALNNKPRILENQYCISKVIEETYYLKEQSNTLNLDKVQVIMSLLLKSIKI